MAKLPELHAGLASKGYQYRYRYRQKQYRPSFTTGIEWDENSAAQRDSSGLKSQPQ